ncbi:spermatogenesis associated 2-like [Amphiprion ocellaris]|uniref:spermatogenesis associated 2-like n=1 Tax=Amphiprion ocellaris TaxID=80972 RepID=UPI000C30C960|nr:spermatogenesis associated 2-like [Amphiprion ocellaris]XP_023151572.1 spermatogenesis associated 2-like [Amphiprion ocellaris]XP_023151573.1 spermatogenesis associated 2-like [Amphiprion ocellaris]
MSVSWQRGRDLVKSYHLSLEQQIVGRGCSLAVKDEDLWRRVEELLRDGDPQEIHCLSLDPLSVMEESLKAAASSRRRLGPRGGLTGLAKAFELLEQVALNVYLAPWREEYRVIKMYSGLFTHHITPVLSPPQIKKLFGLLGYQISPTRPEELLLDPSRIRHLLDELLPLSCAFFLARCECRLLLAALGKHDGDAQWELSLVRERQQGSSLQVAIETTQRSLEPFDVEEDLYRDEQANGDGMQQTVAADDAGPHSVTWTTQSSAVSPPAAKTNGVTTSDPSEPDASWSPGRRFDRRFDASDSLLGEAPEANHLCSCLQSYDLCLRRCIECNALHNVFCASLDVCKRRGHEVKVIDDEAKEPKAASPQRASPAAMSSLTLRDDDLKPTSPTLQPIGFHECCDLAKLDPQVFCRSCSIFHADSCRERDFCQNKHDVRTLGVCSCGKHCSRKPLVLCRYCGKEYCNPCWYRTPLSCSCGQTFDQSSAV